ncbi:hypothetical protein [Polyangium aurulentum]|uniref:hypothetical protein n=1 Tax=Polyangium aurulentum TaxID=2567896 RepID=UPI0010AE08EE|nr:hypothetical protein [Polyangium aurulentum]UQA54923.1 hypothetical protein E8A73_026550 [Polyangium aurulentum]
MADRFIDQDETQIYGPHTSKHIRTWLIGLVKQYDPALEYVANQIDASTAAVKVAIDAARAKDAERRKGTLGKAPLLKAAKKLLGQFSLHLAVHDQGAVDRKVFFTKDGTATSVGAAVQEVLLVVKHIATMLAEPKSPVRDAAHWKARFEATAKALAPMAAAVEDARVERRSLTPEVEAARQVWLKVYCSAKPLVESLLRQVGRVEQMSLVFHDLAVPAGAKVKAPPTDAPAAPLTR